jgi:nucleotide-binding universal stress UspA family protein
MLVKDLLQQSHDFLERSKDHLGGGNIDTIVKEGGDFVETLLETAKEISADLIVIGTHSRRGLDKLLNGSVAPWPLHKLLHA